MSDISEALSQSQHLIPRSQWLTDAVRVAIVGSGPAGFYAAVELLRDTSVPFAVDMFDRLPTPFGLVRTGVAPDRQKIKTVTHKYSGEVEACYSRYRLFGNVELGRDVSMRDLLAHYHAVVVATGAGAERMLGIAGEELDGVIASSEFVGWYNGHPDHARRTFDFSARRAVIIGSGNVALDVARILSRTANELKQTDIADHALAALSASQVREVLVLGRSDAARSAYTPVELEELTSLADADVVVTSEERTLDSHTREELEAGTLEARAVKNLRIIESRTLTSPGRKPRTVMLRFRLRPVEIVGSDGKVTAVRVQRTEAVRLAGGKVERRPVGPVEEIACGLVFRSIGYRVVPVPGLPYDQAHECIPHDRGQVLDGPQGSPVAGLFVAGWAKRGAKGIIGTNKPDAAETVQMIRQAAREARLSKPTGAHDVADLLRDRGVDFLTYSDWKVLDEFEVRAGQAEGRPRSKFVDLQAMKRALGNGR